MVPFYGFLFKFSGEAVALQAFSEHGNRHAPGRVPEIYPSSHNHGSVENGCISNISFLSFRVIFHFHDYGRKGSEDDLAIVFLQGL